MPLLMWIWLQFSCPPKGHLRWVGQWDGLFCVSGAQRVLGALNLDVFRMMYR